jgi:hypothetical protein
MKFNAETNGLYILDGKTPIPCFDITKWGSQSKEDKTVGRDQFGDVSVSTVFLGMDHSFSGGTPVLFETMIFGGEYDQYQERYCTWDEAESGHQIACKLVNKVAIDRHNKLNDLGI